MLRRILILCFAIFIGPTLQAHVTPATTSSKGQDFSYSDALVLGLIQGVTEFLPISSTGHLILANHFLELDQEIPLFNEAGELIVKYPATNEASAQPYTLKDAAYAYNVVLHAGTILAICILYWKYILEMICGLFGRNANGLLLLRNLFVAFIPAGAVGYFLHDAINIYLYTPKMVGVALVLGAFIMISVEKWRQTRPVPQTNGFGPQLHELTVRRSLCIGLLQTLAMWPGTSRSMMTIVGGYLVGFNPKRAAEFSFLLGLMTVSAASLYKIYKEGMDMMNVLYWEPMLFGCLIALISGVLAIKTFIHLLTRYGLAPFAWYRIVLAVVTLVALT